MGLMILIHGLILVVLTDVEAILRGRRHCDKVGFFL